MTEIQITSTKRYDSYAEVSYKMTFTLPAILGTGSNPIAGFDRILSSYPNFSSEIIPVIGTVITVNETKSVELTVTLPQAETFLQNRYAEIRLQLDAFVLSPYDSLAGLSWDGITWATSSGITDIASAGVLMLTGVGAAAAGVTLTLPASVNKFHNIIRLDITAYSSSARTGNATPVTVTTTNLNGVAYTFATAAAIGTADQKIIEPTLPIKSILANTNTTIVCPATTGIIWRINCFYNLQ